MDLSKDLDAARMHALNLHSLFEEDPENGGELLDAAINEFNSLVGKSEGQQRLDNILSLCGALNDKSEAGAQGRPDEVLPRVVEIVRQWLPDYPSDTNSLGNARLNLYLAQALQGLGERTGDDPTLVESEAAYNQAIAGLQVNRDPGGRLTDAKSGLAAVLQVRGEAEKNSSMLRRAVALHRELAEVSRGAERSKEEAGPLENLAGSLTALAALADPEEAGVLYAEAKAALERAIRIYERQGQTDQENLAREALETVEAAISGDGNAGNAG
jgi:tetratricopeptide (TPR) repeat protein